MTNLVSEYPKYRILLASPVDQQEDSLLGFLQRLLNHARLDD